jgi:tetratricopeptide (TPR) repeat protein
LLEYAKARYPQNVEVAHELARAYTERGWPLEAIKELERARALDAASAGIWLDYANVSVELARYEAAGVAYQMALRLDPRSADAMVGLALLELHRSGRFYETFASRIEAALRAKPDHAEAHFLLGLWLLAKGNAIGASEHLARFNETTPDQLPLRPSREEAAGKGDRSSSGRILLGLACLEAERACDPRRPLQAAVDLAAEHDYRVAEAVETRAVARRYFEGLRSGRGTLDCARRRRGLGEDPPHRAASASKGRLVTLEELAPQLMFGVPTVSDLANHRRDDPKSDAAVVLSTLRGEAFFSRARYREALQHYQRAVALHPHGARGHLLVGDAYYALEDYRNAVAAFRESVRFDDTDKLAWSFLGDAYAELGQLDAAEKAFERAAKIDPTYHPPTKGRRILEMNRGKEAP